MEEDKKAAAKAAEAEAEEKRAAAAKAAAASKGLQESKPKAVLKARAIPEVRKVLLQAATVSAVALTFSVLYIFCGIERRPISKNTWSFPSNWQAWC